MRNHSITAISAGIGSIAFASGCCNRPDTDEALNLSIPIGDPSAESRLRAALAEHVAALTDDEIAVIARAAPFHLKMNWRGLAEVVRDSGGTYTDPARPPAFTNLSGAAVRGDMIVAGRDRLRGDPEFGIPNPGPAAMLQDWIFGVVLHSDSSGAVGLPLDISASGAPAVIVALPVELPTQRIALVMTFVEVNGRLIPYRSDCFATQTADNPPGAFPAMRPLL